MKTWLVLVLALVVGVSTAGAESKKKKPVAAKKEPEPPPPPVEEPPVEDPLADIPHVKGPKLVSLGMEMEIDLPEGVVLLEKVEAAKMVRENGGDAEGVIGAVVNPEKNWLVLIEWAPIGYVTDNDAHELDAAELLESYKKGTVEQNVRRKSMGVPELFVDGWSEKPRYEKAQHILLWGLNAHTDEGPVINFFTRILGRGGFISVNLIDEPAAIEAAKAETAPIRSAIRFKTGNRYEDYKEGDKSAGIGLKALVLGGGAAVVAKKAGVIAAILLVFKKFFIFIFIGIAGVFKWLFSRRKKPEEAIATEPPPPDPTPST